MEKQYTINLTYGDPSRDGHGISETDSYNSTHNAQALELAVLKTDAKLELDFDNFACEYDDPTVLEEDYSVLAEHIPNINDYIEDDEDRKYITDFTGLYLAYAKISLPELETEHKPREGEYMDIGGYGAVSAP